MTDHDRLLAQLRNDERLYGFSVVDSATGERVDPRSLTPVPATTQGREAAQAALEERRANQPKHIDNASLPAGSDMYYYCKSCGHLACVLPESWISGLKKLCDECQAMKDCGWLED